MVKVNILFGVFMIFLLVFSVVVYGAGTSTVTRETDVEQVNEDSAVTNNAVDKNEDEEVPKTEDGRGIRDVQKRVNCEEPETRRERIKCRLKNEIEEGEDDAGNTDYEKRVPEACRNLRNPVACIALYKKVNSNRCYHLTDGKQKDRCFKISSDIRKEKLKDIPPEERREKARNYMVLLLYELQERIEHANENGKIDDDSSAEIIDLIVEIKEDLMNGGKKSEILPKLRELRNKIREHRTGGESE